ncbi:hypothetical protein Aspvir_010181 [Aspergillus viridinutans]|uniref:Uncharacterized protein n=1 Tax=Aspergillus viridinutans TaxID=75553 RepID=A0A9P3C4J7_ASPVI|nr:uncharacterized protein Aspvir_010181 [Aspergillus viridinutans]GIK06063.1 hypothetical protein Aspvir_010181 [Aspergillus viridinutans]
MVVPELGTYANPIVIGDDLAPLGSASNPIVIQVDEGWCREEPDQLGSDADTEIMATPEFWETLTGANFAIPVKDDAAIDSAVSVPIGSLVREDPEALQPFKQSTLNGFQSDDKALKVMENSLDSSRESPRFRAVRRESVVSDHRGALANNY